MKILTNQAFLDGYDRYETDTEYEVESARGEYFCRNGWASSEELSLPSYSVSDETELEVHDVTQGTETSNE